MGQDMKMSTAFDDLIAEMDHIVEDCRSAQSRAGYFAALYRNVTRELRRQSESGAFPDPTRMVEFTSIFAHRYLDAYSAWRSGRATTAAWSAAFSATDRWRPIVLQHLLLGMNAHINLDLGVVGAELGDRYGLDEIGGDFHALNDLLSSMILRSQQAVDSVSPWIGLLDRLGGRNDTTVVRFSLIRAREAAWHSAQRLSPMSSDDRAAAVDELDANIQRLSRVVAPGPFLLSGAMLLVRFRERRSVRDVIDALSTVG